MARTDTERALDDLRAQLTDSYTRHLAEAEQRAAYASYGLDSRGTPFRSPGSAYIAEDTATGEAGAWREALVALELALVDVRHRTTIARLDRSEAAHRRRLDRARQEGADAARADLARRQEA